MNLLSLYLLFFISTAVWCFCTVSDLAKGVLDWLIESSQSAAWIVTESEARCYPFDSEH